MVSLKRIAAELDVSYTLVSKVLSGRLGTTGVSMAKREAILNKARELNYVPNRLAVALKAGRKGTVGIFFHHMGIPGSDLSDRLLKGLAEGLDEAAIRMWLRFFVTDLDFASACDSRLKPEVDGLIVAGVYHPHLKDRLRKLEQQNVPVVTMFNDDPERDPGSGVTKVQVSYEMHGYLPAKHLLDLGCRRIACLDTVASRTAGFVRAHQEKGIGVDKKLIIPAKGFFMHHGREVVPKLLKSKIPVEGIVCQSDAQANGVINELILRGRRVPEDIKVTGVDNSPVAEECIVPITSVTSELRQAGRSAVEILLQKIESRKVKSVMISPKLVVRASTGAPPTAGIKIWDLE